MQQLSTALKAALIDIDARVTPRVLVDLYEFYPSDYVPVAVSTTPGTDGFDPADAIETFAAEEITWNGIAYRREVISRGDVVRNFGEKTNSVNLNFSNISRYMATLAQSQQMEGLFLVIRTVVPSVTDDSIVLFVGRADKPSDIDKKEFSLSARQDFGNINQELPPRTFAAEDPNGRTPSDPLYEGFRIIALNGSFSIPVTTASTSFFGRLFGKKKTEMQTRQWSSLDATPYGSPVPMIFGRCQMEFIPILFADIGFHLIGVWVLGEGRVEDFTNVTVRDDRYLVQTVDYHFGDPGGTGTNATNMSSPTGPINQGYLSKTAYTILSMYGSAGDVIDEAPTVTALAKGVRVPVPDSAGDFNSEAWSDNPAAIARFILTDPRLVGIDPGFMEDDVNYETYLHCAEPLIDDSNGELTLIPTPDFAQIGIGIQRYRSTGIIDTPYVDYYLLSSPIDAPEFEDPPIDPYDPGDIPTTFPITRVLRKRYTVNIPITERVRAVDFLYKMIFLAAKLFLRINKRGKYEIRSERPSDATMLRAATVVGDTSIPILDVTPWKTGPDLLTQRLLLGFALTNSEVRNVSSAVYSTSGNSVTLDTAVTGSITATKSGANLAGGSTTVQASATVTIGGTPAAGNTVSITIDGIVSGYVLNAGDTTGTVASLLASHINANPRLNRYIKATWLVGSPTIITITCKHGALTLDSALLKVHTGPIADPTTTPVLADSAGALEAGTYKLAYADVTAIGRTALSPQGSIVISANKQIDVGAIALVGTSRDWYMSDAANSEYLKFVANTNGSAFSINALPLPNAAIPRGYNTTGEELIRVAMSFATNSQDIFPVWPASTPVLLTDVYLPTTPNGHKYSVTTAGTTGATEPTWPTTAGGTVASGTVVFTEAGSTVLQQAGLTRANIKKDTYKWPLGSRQSSINQIKGNYRDSNNDFALTPFKVNDPIHQAQVSKVYPLEADLSAIDNSHQKDRIANWLLAKHREGDWFNALETGPQGLVLEEGDPICSSDDSGGLVNIVTRIEELRIHPNHDVSIAQARKYSTLMFADEVGADTIPIPSTLRFIETVDSIIEFIDNYPIRDVDGLTPGFYVVISRDLATLGDWRGWTLYADYGDGYVQIAKNDIPAIMGTATTTLGSVTDPSVWDRTNSLTFTLKYGPPTPFPSPFATVPEQDLLSNSRRNLFLVGNEYLQAATVVDNGNLSYTISTLLRGRFGTDNTQITHSSSERVVYLDGSENFVSIDVTRLNGVFNYKAVTTNQSLAGATAVPFSWTGGNLRPLSPVNLRGRRDTEGNLLIEWTRRSRLSPGLTPGSDVPIAEEAENYVVEIRTSGNILKRTMAVAGNGSTRPAILIPQLEPQFTVGNNIIPGGDTPNAITAQILHESGAWIEATLRVFDIDSIALIALPDAGYRNRLVDGEMRPVILFSRNPFMLGLTIREFESDVYSSGTLGPVNSVRIRILISGSEMRYYWDYTGPGSVPFYVSKVPAPLPVIGVVSTIGIGASVENVTLGTSASPSVIYSADQQDEDFGSLQNPVRVRVSQVSSIVGRGEYSQADI